VKLTGLAASDRPPAGVGRRRAMLVVVVGYMLFVYLFSPFNSLFLGWFVDFEDAISHRVHEITFGSLFAIVLVGVGTQLRSPDRHIAGLQQALVTVVVLSAVVAASTGWEWTSLLYLLPLVTIALLHPARRQIVLPPVKMRPVLALLVVAASLPALTAFVVEFSKATLGVRGHQSHWGGMASFALVVPAIGAIAAAGVPGWPVAAWSSGLAAIAYGVASLAFPFDASGRPALRAVLTVLWGLVFIGVAERFRLHDRSKEPRRYWSRFALGVPAALFAILVGSSLYGLAGSFSPPPVPHSITSVSPAYCADCHATGQQHAPLVLMNEHPGEEFERPEGVLPVCADCHALPEVQSVRSPTQIGSIDVSAPSTWPFPISAGRSPLSAVDVETLATLTRESP